MELPHCLMPSENLSLRHYFMFYLQLEYLAAEYYPTHWYHKESAVVDPNWTFGDVTPKTVSSYEFIHAC